MKWFFKGLINFLVNMFTASSDVSSKRVNGTFCINVVLIILLLCTIFNFPISAELYKLIKMVFWGGTMLLGLGIADNYFNKK